MISFSNYKSDLTEAINGILYCAPHTIAGYGTVCASSSAGCREACLYSAGRGSYHNVQQARIARTKLWYDNRGEFIRQVESDIDAAIRRGKREGKQVYIRTGGTWDQPKLYRHLKRYSGVEFYEYTKHELLAWTRARISHDVDLTFSLDERDRWDVAKSYMDIGLRCAVVFRVKRHMPLPEKFRGYPVIDGDLNDLRPDDPPGIVGLRVKGKAIHDRSGFVYER